MSLADRHLRPLAPGRLSCAAAPAATEHASPQVVILAAGMGTRLGRSLPKPLTPLRDGRSILRRQLDGLQTVLRDDAQVTLVVGYGAEHVMRAVPEARFVHNADYARTNTSQSLRRALQDCPPGGVLWLNGDVVFDPAALEPVVAMIGAEESFVCVNTASVSDEEVKYTLDAEGYVRELSKTVVGGLGEAVGINYVSAAHRQVLLEHLGRCADSDYFERGLETAIAHDGLRVRPLDISAFAAVEVDFADDLVRANLLCLPTAQS